MFNNLIESQSHRKEFKRQGRFLMATTLVYTLAFFIAGIASIYAYDAQLEAQNSSLELISMVPPVAAKPATQPKNIPQPKRAALPNAPVRNNITVPIRTQPVSTVNNPTLVPPNVGIEASKVPPITGLVRIGAENVNPPGSSTNDGSGCATCTGNSTNVVLPNEIPPEPVKIVPKTQPLTSTMLRSKAVNLPQPQYPEIAKRIRLQGPVVIQVLVDETGKVVSAQVVSGNPVLTTNAREAALRARFTPTILNNQPVKVQGMITYNFVLQ